MVRVKIIFLLSVAIVLSSCTSPNNNVRIFSTKTIVEECRGALTKEEGKKFNLAVKLLDKDAGINASIGWDENKGYDVLSKSNLKSDDANIEALRLFYECRRSFYFPKKKNI